MPARGSTAESRAAARPGPERRMGAREIARLTGLHRNTILGYMKAGGPLFCGAAILGGKLTVPESTYLDWVEQGRIDR